MTSSFIPWRHLLFAKLNQFTEVPLEKGRTPQSLV